MMRNWSLIRMLQKPANLPLSLSRRLPGGACRSLGLLAELIMSSFLLAPARTAASKLRASRELMPWYTSEVALSPKVPITSTTLALERHTFKGPMCVQWRVSKHLNYAGEEG